MSRVLYFYATRADVLQLCKTIEAEQELTFALVGRLETSQPVCYSNAIDIPGFGVARAGWILGESCYLAIKRGARIRVITRRRSDGAKFYYLAQKQNPSSVEFRPSGVYDKNSIIQGTVGTILKSRESVDLFEQFQCTLRKQFSLIHGIYIGTEALELGKQGARLTQSIKLPTATDLKIS